jgi:hypothetical protein
VQPQEIQKRGRGDVFAVPKSPGGPQADSVGSLKDTGGVQQLQRDNGSGFGGCVGVLDLGSKVEGSKRLGHNRVTSLVVLGLWCQQYLTPCFARGPERFFHVFISRLLGHIAALFVRHLTPHPDPGTFRPEGERPLSREALLWLLRGDLAVRKLRIEGGQQGGRRQATGGRKGQDPLDESARAKPEKCTAGGTEESKRENHIIWFKESLKKSRANCPSIL